MPDIPLRLLQRITERANDLMRRTYTSGAHASARPLDVGGLTADLRKHGAPGAQGLIGALGKLQSLMGGAMGGALMMGPGGIRSIGRAPTGPQPLSPPPDEAELTDAETAIGRRLPKELRQLYAIADGGFGPGEGLFPLAELVKRFHELTDEPYGPLGQDWPASLLPLFDEDPVLIGLDLDTGQVVAWDPEEIEDEDSDEDWRRTFKPQHPNLAALMEAWLKSPTFDEQYDTP